MDTKNLENHKLPRQIETDPRREKVEQALSRELTPIWEEGTLKIAHLEFSPALEAALVSARVRRHLERGLETIEKVLRNEENGLAALREKNETATSGRVSRLLIIADGGSQRFYRSCEILLSRHADRVLGLRVRVPDTLLSQKIYSKEGMAKALLVSDRDSVSEVLFSLV